jgi:hypothetical protein
MILDCLIDVDRVLTEQRISHAFGGALALANYADPRGTNDVDVNVATQFTEAEPVLKALKREGFSPEGDPALALPAAGIRMVRGFDEVNLFFSLDSSNNGVFERSRVLKIKTGGASRYLQIIGPDDLVAFKVSSNRGKDWVDIEAMIAAGTEFNPELIREELLALRGPTMLPRIARLSTMLENKAK